MATLIKIKFFDNGETKPFKGASTLEGSLRNFKKFLRKVHNRWEYATVFYQGKIHCYFHPNTQDVELDLKSFNQELKTERINLFIVYTYEHKLKTGSYSGKPIYNSSVQDMPLHYGTGVEKILAYQNDKIIATYQDGKFL